VATAASVCADETDFAVDTDNGRLKLSPHFVQNELENFVFTLDGDQNVFEKVTDFDDVVIPVSGYYYVTMDVHGNATITPATPPNVVGAQVSAQLRVNNSPIAGTETMIQLNSQGVSALDEPALQLHGSGSSSRVVYLTLGQRLSIWGKRNSDPGTTSTIVSDNNGRCRITAMRFGGA
jgi:hypothetical protein